MVPTHQTQQDRWGCGPLPVLQTFRGKEPFSRRVASKKERVIVPGCVETAGFEGLWFDAGVFIPSIVCFVFDFLSGDTRIINLRVVLV